MSGVLHKTEESNNCAAKLSKRVAVWFFFSFVSLREEKYRDHTHHSALTPAAQKYIAEKSWREADEKRGRKGHKDHIVKLAVYCLTNRLYFRAVLVLILKPIN